MEYRLIYNNRNRSVTCNDLQKTIDTGMAACLAGVAEQALIFAQHDDGHLESVGAVSIRRDDNASVIAFAPSTSFTEETFFCRVVKRPAKKNIHQSGLFLEIVDITGDKRLNVNGFFKKEDFLVRSDLDEFTGNRICECESRGNAFEYKNDGRRNARAKIAGI